MKNSVWVLLFLSMTSAVRAADPVLVSGEWNCTLEGKSKYFKSGSYQLKIEESKGGKHTMRLSMGEQFLSGTESESNFLVEKGNLLDKKNHGYFSIYSPTKNFEEFQFTAGVKVEKGEYDGDRFNCRAEKAPVLMTLKTNQFSCKTDEPLEGKTNTVSFTVAGIGTRHITIDGDADDDMPIKFTPEKSIFVLFNENTGIFTTDKTLELTGDGDGVTLVYLVLYKNSGYHKGYYKVKDNSGDNDHHYGTVSCTVK